MKGRFLLALPLVLALCVASPAFAQYSTGAIAQVDAHAEVVAALYAASATQEAKDRESDAKLRAERTKIADLRARVRAGDARLRASLTAAEEAYVAALATRDRAYAQEVAVFRATVTDIAATPEGAAALARFNAGDEIGAVAILVDLRAAHDMARKKRADIESAAEGRGIATLTLEARAKGKLTTAQVINLYEEVTRLDPGEHSDWVQLSRLYRDAGKLSNALRAAEAAVNTAKSDRDRSVAFGERGNVLVVQGDRRAALESYRAALGITERLVKADPANTEWQRDLSVDYERIGDVLLEQDDLPASLESYRETLAIRERLVEADPRNTRWLWHLSVSQKKIGDVLHEQGALTAALAMYRNSLSIDQHLFEDDPTSLVLQRDLWVSYEKIGDVLLDQREEYGSLGSYNNALAIAERLAQVDPSNAEWQRDLSMSHGRVGDALFAQGDQPAALMSYRASLDVVERLNMVESSNADLMRDWIVSLVKNERGNRRQGLRCESVGYCIGHAEAWNAGAN
jgi:tetratricopeptide (TPR) repeat protein